MVKEKALHITGLDRKFFDEPPDEDAELIQSLIEAGIHVYPTRRVAVSPNPDISRLRCQEEDLKKVSLGLNCLSSYLKGAPIGDKFHNHEERRKWRHEMTRRFPHFSEFYERANQFRINNITKVSAGMQLIAKIGLLNGQTELARDLYCFPHDILYRSRHYEEMKTNGEKLVVVRFVEDQIVDFVKTIEGKP